MRGAGLGPWGCGPGQGPRAWRLKRSQKTTLSARLPLSTGVTLTLPLGHQPGFFTGLCPDMEFPATRWWVARRGNGASYALSPGASSPYEWFPMCASHLVGLGVGGRQRSRGLGLSRPALGR